MATYDPASPVGSVRLLISDTDENDALFSDAEIERFLALRRSEPLRAAALALRTIASNEAQVLKVIRLMDLQTDGASLARELRMQAGTLEDTADSDSEDAFAVIEVATEPFGLRDRWLRQMQRRAL